MRGLLLTLEGAFLALLVITAAIGGLWALFWHNASAEAVRINALYSGAQALRGDVYRGVKEVTRAQLRAEPEALEKYWRLLYGIDLAFNRLDQATGGDAEDAAIDAMREAWARMQTAMNRVFAGSDGAPEAALIEQLDPTYEQFILGDFEDGFQRLTRAIDVRRGRLETKLARFNQLAPLLITLPIAIGIALLLITRRRFRRDFVIPMNSIRSGASRMRQGELQTRIPGDGVRELQELSLALNDMALDLARSRDALIAQERQAALGALVPVVAHNIRNPLASIRAAVQVVDVGDEAEWQEVRREVIATVDRLGRWVSSLLSYLHPLRPHPVTCAVDRLVDGALAPCLPKAEEKRLRFERGDRGTGLTLEADVDLVEQALHGLISNAIEASPVGGVIRIDATREVGAGTGEAVDAAAAAPAARGERAAAGGAPVLRLTIADEGPGIPPQTEPESLRPGPTTKRRGTGLGIPFAWKVVTGHGGRLWFERPAQGGTRVCIELPERAAGDDRADAPEDAATTGAGAGAGDTAGPATGAAPTPPRPRARPDRPADGGARRRRRAELADD